MVGTLSARTPTTQGATRHVRSAPVAVAAAPAYTVETIRDFSVFLDLEAEWNDAVDRAGIAHPFLRHEWIRTWWECFAGDRELHILVVRALGRVVAIAPLMLERTRMYRVPVRRLRLMENDHTPCIDILVTERPHEVYRAIWKALRQTPARWDVLLLSQILSGSATGRVMPDLARTSGNPTGVWDSEKSPYLELTGTWESYHASLSAKFRSNLRNRLSRLTQLGEPRLEVLRDAASIRAACDDALRLEASGWKAQEGTSICSDPAVRRFYTTLADRGTESGWLHLMFLNVNGRRMATSYGAVYGGRLFLFKTGYDPEYAKCSPFKLLTYFAIQQAYREGLSELDFLGDAEPWKLEWTTATRGHDWVFVFARGPRARLVHQAKFHVVPAIRRWRARG